MCIRDRYSGVRPCAISGARAIVRLASVMAAVIRATGSRSSSALAGPKSPIRLRVRPFSDASVSYTHLDVYKRQL